MDTFNAVFSCWHGYFLKRYLVMLPSHFTQHHFWSSPNVVELSTPRFARHFLITSWWLSRASRGCSFPIAFRCRPSRGFSFFFCFYRTRLAISYGFHKEFWTKKNRVKSLFFNTKFGNRRYLGRAAGHRQYYFPFPLLGWICKTF